MMRFQTLADWLAWQETLHPKAIDLGLDRVKAVAERLGVRNTPHTVITVGGTNGKGSSVAMLEAVLRCAGLRVGAYSSPHLREYNERIRVGGHYAEDRDIIESFARIDAARGDTSLSYFEFGTLAALDVFARSDLNVAVLEVGLGGRLDAVNLVDADCALVTGVGIDHVEWLGPDRESIGREKAGIFRPGRPAVCSDPEPPVSLRREAAAKGAVWFGLGEQYGYRVTPRGWDWWGPGAQLDDLPFPTLSGPFQLQNAAGVLMALRSIEAQLPVTADAVRTGLQDVRLPGRFQIIPGAVERVFDVAHNPHAARGLAVALAQRPVNGKTLAVCGMLADKDAAGIAAELREQVDAWYLGSLGGERGQSAATLAERIGLPEASRRTFAEIEGAYAAAERDAKPGDRILVFGSFRTVAELLPAAYNAATADSR